MNFEDRYFKVSVGGSHKMHVADMTPESYKRRWLTLCGLLWETENNHGETHCQNCQRILAKRKAEHVTKRPVAGAEKGSEG